MQKLYSVLTCIFGDYEMVREPINASPLCEYVLVTDNPNLKSDFWDIVVCDHPFPAEYNNNTKSFYVKYHPFEFVNTQSVIWIDGSVQIMDDLTQVAWTFLNSDCHIGEVFNIVNSNSYNEILRWMENADNWTSHNFKSSDLSGVKKFFEDHCYDTPDDPDASRHGMIQTTIYMCKNDAIANRLNNITWDLMLQCGVGGNCAREYMGLRSYVINNYLEDPLSNCMFFSPTILWCDYFDYKLHNSDYSQREVFINSTVFYPDDYHKLENWVLTFHNTWVQPIVFPY